MAGMAEVKQRGRPSKSGKVRSFVCEVVPPALTSKLVFQDSLNKGRGFWFTKLVEMRNIPGASIKLLAADKSSLSQIKQKAKSIGLRLLYATDEAGEFVYIKPVEVTGDIARLMLLLREARTVNELKSQQPALELDLAHELQGLGRRGLAVERGGKWVLTAEGAATVKAGGVGKGAAA